MDTTSRLPSVRSTRIATVATLVAFVGYVVVPDSLRILALVAMTLAAAGVVAGGIDGIRRTSGPTATGMVAAGCAVGLVGSVLYLTSLADEPTAIPLVGVFVLLASLVGLAVSLFTVRSTSH